MTYEEKLAEAKRLYQTANKDQKYLLESLFPEIIEDEDERVRKALIKFLQECYNIDSGFFTRYCAIPYNQMLAWLKKQAKESQRMISAEAKEALYDKPTWRPSEEQMQMLHRAVVAIAPGVVHDGLESIYNDLKNL